MSDFFPQESFQTRLNRDFVAHPPQSKPPLLRSFIATLFFFPLGVLALIFCFVSGTYYYRESFYRAAEFAKSARIMANLGIICGAALWLVKLVHVLFPEIFSTL